jgi:cytochrome b6-f complex iron-sulfur subunit
MDNVPSDRDDSDRIVITSLADEAPYQARDEAADSTRARLARRHFLRRSMLAVSGLSATVMIAGALHMLYPNLDGQFGGLLDVGSRAGFPVATPENFKLNQTGVFYQIIAKTFIVHLAKEAQYLAAGSLLEAQLEEEQFVRDPDGSYWLALYQRCVHLGTPVIFRNDCTSFKCPSHGTHYHCDGEYLDGPAPRSMDRFPLFIQNERILIDTSRITQVPRPNSDQRILPVPLVECLA